MYSAETLRSKLLADRNPCYEPTPPDQLATEHEIREAERAMKQPETGPLRSRVVDLQQVARELQPPTGPYFHSTKTYGPKYHLHTGTSQDAFGRQSPPRTPK